MSKVLTVDPSLCTGCHRCEMWCSLTKYGEINPSRSNVYVIRREPAVDVPVVCVQCGLCMDVCPTGALNRNGSTDAVEVDVDLCSGCGTCVKVCPYGVLRIDEVADVAAKCDLCGGSPACAGHCPHDAIKYEDAGKAAARRRELWAMAHAIKIG
ncbi:4Fe-4S dicluster domain-containing protein [Desulfoscipio geothermicus]|uniref:Fe-S-cluster-containing dehydrogenase component n=1 Tax=Desulfoscipio geothermicus DSM 3669 TaxID=1121426 RepID=A0A1I6DR26_9FIRM|nr:4Fe-4S dicluster domain-containing protein [Desulfoscipio geothermicus]SFR07817.1 Fe-S-cluster-containing dehydrogenase component [Desulfoscipio geothermicus DSM 3669]